MTQEPEPTQPPHLPYRPSRSSSLTIDSENPWGDDVLDRKEIAERLTSIVRGQEASVRH